MIDISPVRSPEGDIMTSSLINRRTALAGLGVFALAGCSFSFGDEKKSPRENEEEKKEKEKEKTEESEEGEDSTSEEEDDSTTEEEADEETDPEEEDEDTDSAAGAEGVEVPIGLSFTDEELGDEFSIISVKRDMPSESAAGRIEDGCEVFWLQIEFSPTGEWGGALSTNEFYIDDEGEAQNASSAMADEIKAAGLTPMNLPARRDGETGPIWMAFATWGQRQETYSAAYIRPATEVIGEDRTLPEFRYEFEIPAA